MDWDVIVIGAGPAGCFTAQSIAARGFKVAILEEDNTVGEPVQCAGLISPRALELAGLDDDIVLNKLRGLRVFSPLGATLHVDNSRVCALAIDRAEFDKKLALKAENVGAVLLTDTEVKGLEPVAGGYRVGAVRNRKDITLQARLVIGADGTNSKVAKWLKLDNNNPRAVMFAADAQIQRDNTEIIDVFLGRQLAPGWFGWLIPLDRNTCRVGTGYAFVQQKHSPKYLFEQMVTKFPEVFRGIRILRCTGGTVSFGPMPKIYGPHAMLVGDAANQTKPISGGGIYTGFRGAQYCAQIAVQSLNEDSLTEARLARYQELWEKGMGKEIECSMGYRESFLDLSDKEIDMLIRFLGKPKWLNTILQYGDIDYPSFLATKLYLLHPVVKTLFSKIRFITPPSFNAVHSTDRSDTYTAPNVQP